MPFLDRLSKSVGRAAEQAKFEADKMVRVNKLNSEVSELGKQMEQITMQVGRQVVEMYRAGTLQVPQLSDQFMQLSELEKQLDTKKGDLDAAKATRFEDISGPADTGTAGRRDARRDTNSACGRPHLDAAGRSGRDTAARYKRGGDGHGAALHQLWRGRDARHQVLPVLWGKARLRRTRGQAL